ncbi:MAG: flagellin [Hahellaceae bacterium]|nr:flagellin [Hahellaceae bacterium]
MPQVINTNIASLNAQRNLDRSQNLASVSLQRLSSGLRINSAKDDAAGLAISTRFDAQIRGTSVAIRNAGDGISLAQTGEGSLNNITTALQRMRELALQSANGSNTDLERSSIQEEVDQLKAEIASISKNTNFNGRNLLDGSFQNVSFQTGANVGETISVSIAKTTEATLGTAVTNGISSSTTTGASLASGDLTINGISVPAANAANDGASSASPELSSITLAAAINSVADLSGVEAKVNANFVGGTSVASVSNTAGTVSINGTSISLQGTGQAANLAADLQSVAEAINLHSGETGVKAMVDLNNLDGGVSLVADDGRNIQITGASAASFGLKAAGTYTGTYTLVSRDGSDITIGSTTGKSQESAGLEIGTYSGANSGINGAAVTGSISAGDLSINGVSIGPSLTSYDNASTTGKAGSAISIATAINQVSDKTGVTAKAQATQVTSSDLTANQQVSGLEINGITINAAASGTGSTSSQQVALVVNAINEKAAQTGVRAEVVDDNQFQLIADDGRNINVGGTVTNTGLSATTTRGSVTLSSAGQITVGSANSTGPSASGFAKGTYGGAETGVLVKDISVLTVADAEKAVKGIDNALNQVSRAAAQLGAIQNRFESTISNLSTKSENLSAANSRIRDADFAAETSALSKAQVLQQAGISVLAQANARPQQVLSLLQ